MKLFHDMLVEAQKQRDSRADWIQFERETMLYCVNAERQRLGLPPVPMTDIEKVETISSGHFDYTKKFAYFCSRLAQGEQITREWYY